MESAGARAVFVDRDGTLIRDVGYLRRVEELEILPRVPEAVRLLRDHGLKVVVVTNQSAIARGILTAEKLEEIHDELRRQLARHGAHLDAIYYCPHHPTEGLGSYRISCECRKPNVGLIKRAQAELDLEIHRSYVVGDQLTDMELAVRVGAKGILIAAAEGDRSQLKGKFPVAGDLGEAARWIIGDLGRQKH